MESISEYSKDHHIQLLESTNQTLVEKLLYLKKRMQQRNDEQTLKWRNKAYYWQRKYLELVERSTIPNKGDGNGEIRNIRSTDTEAQGGSTEGNGV